MAFCLRKPALTTNDRLASTLTKKIATRPEIQARGKQGPRYADTEALEGDAHSFFNFCAKIIQ